MKPRPRSRHGECDEPVGSRFMPVEKFNGQFGMEGDHRPHAEALLSWKLANPLRRSASKGSPMPSSSSSPDAPFAIVIFGQPTSPHAVAELLADIVGEAPTDALIHSRFAPGVLPERLDRPTADRLVEKLAGIGLQAEAIDSARLLNFRGAHVVHHAEILDDGLNIITERGTANGTIPWSKFSVFSAGQIPLESSQRYDWNDEHLFATARRSHHEPHRATLPPVMQLWLVNGGETIPIRIDQTRMNYETLGTAKTDSSAENFRNFLLRLLQKAPGVHVTPATRA
jgi:hypothetical protein